MIKIDKFHLKKMNKNKTKQVFYIFNIVVNKNIWWYVVPLLITISKFRKSGQQCFFNPNKSIVQEEQTSIATFPILFLIEKVEFQLR